MTNYLKVSTQTGLTDSNVLDIRRAWDAGKYSLSELAEQYGVGKATIHDIVSFKTWSHVPSGKTLADLPGYRVLPDGRVYSSKAQVYLKQKYNKTTKSVTVDLSVNGKTRTVNVGTLVARAFLGSKGNNVSYVDGNNLNVHFTNLKV